jgi:membrane-bound serine protease (ClpP class)
MKVWGHIASVLLVCAMAFSTSAQEPAPTTAPIVSNPAAIVELKGEIDDYTMRALERHFAQARAAGAHTVILQINTYGGLVTAALDISRFIKRQNDLHTIAFVDDKAISAGSMIALACDELVMENNSVIGDCAPIVFQTDGTLQALPAAERAKRESPILAEFRDSATRNHYDPKVAEAMVAVDRVVHYVEKDGQRQFVDANEYTKLKAEGWTPVPGVPDPIDGQSELLTVHSDIAQRIGLSKGTFASPEALAQARGLNIIDTFSAGAGERLVELLNNPLARVLLIIIFIMSVKLALATPGHGAPEAVAIVSGALLLGVPLLTGYAQWWEIVAIFVGVGLLAFEIFVFPGHFLSGAIGLLLIIGGLVLTFVGQEPGGGVLPKLPGTWEALERGLLIVTGGLVASFMLSLWLQRYLPKIPYFNRLVLTATSGGTDSPAKPQAAGLIGEIWPAPGTVGTAITDLRPGGSASFMDKTLGDTRLTSVVSDSGFVPARTNVIVREARRGYVVVRPIAQA